VKVWAHRGASRAERENTITAFERARAMGAHGVELDVRRTRDGALVVHHDAHLGDGRAIVDLRRADLPAHVPDLASALDACAGMDVNVEIKDDPRETIADDTMAVLLERGEPERWLISSFQLETVDRCRAVADGAGAPIRTAWLVDRVPHDAVSVLLDRGHHALHPWVGTLTRETIDECRARGIEVNTWTCDDPDRIVELAAWGVDGVCTNVPDVALSVLERGPHQGR
jgi:glycerophosphoryl diester phosphodiesterase